MIDLKDCPGCGVRPGRLHFGDGLDDRCSYETCRLCGHNTRGVSCDHEWTYGAEVASFVQNAYYTELSRRISAAGGRLVWPGASHLDLAAERAGMWFCIEGVYCPDSIKVQCRGHWVQASGTWETK